MKLEPKQRALLFWSVCIPLRTYLSSLGDSEWLRIAAVVIGTRWVAGLEVGNEGMFGGPAWWADERSAHGVLWLVYAYTGNSIWLKADVVFGIGNWLKEFSSIYTQ